MPNFEQELITIIQQRPSDLYLLPFKDYYRFSLAINGKTTTIKEVSGDEGQRFISYLKYRAEMAVSEHRRPQLGAFSLVVDQQKINLRLSSVGDYQGRESLVIRFIYQLATADFNFLVSGQWQQLKTCCRQRGLILFAGPMGSGKTTTMYQLARTMLPDRIVLTVEDPVEVDEPAFIQLQVNELAAMDYQSLLKLGLRHRPDILIVGEIRDPQTAMMTVQAALSGHLVLGTIHAQSASGVVARLRQLGVDTFYLHQVLTAVCYQRLLALNNDQQAVLADILVADQLTAAINNHGKGAMSDEWTKHLQAAVDHGQITATTAAKYAQG